MIRKWSVKGQIPETQVQDSVFEEGALPEKRCEKMGSLPCGPTCCKDTEKGVNNSVP
jgi:hypothetical protein